MVKRRLPPTRIPFTPSSQPRITSPAPRRKRNLKFNEREKRSTPIVLHHLRFALCARIEHFAVTFQSTGVVHSSLKTQLDGKRMANTFSALLVCRISLQRRFQREDLPFLIRWFFLLFSVFSFSIRFQLWCCFPLSSSISSFLVPK